jgi:hypothetical protein
MTAIAKWAVLSDEQPDPLFRYQLGRLWDATLPLMVWIMLNPSTADHEIDDPTILACIDFAKRNGCGGIVVVNLFAFRSPHPKVMREAADPVGRENDEHLLRVAREAKQAGGYVIAAWGANGAFRNRDLAVLDLLEREGLPVLCFGLTKDQHPKHPLARGHHRIPRDTQPFPLRDAA